MKLFFAFKVMAPWTTPFPRGRLLEEDERHMTVAFLGEADYSVLQTLLVNAPPLPFHVGLTGVFDKLVLLPPSNSRVVAWHVNWQDGKEVEQFVEIFQNWLKGNGVYEPDNRAFLPHATLCRAPFDTEEWQGRFVQLPMYLDGFHLYESIGNLRYKSLWSIQLLPPFEELEHTADLAFRIRGDTVSDLFKNAFFALVWRHIPLLAFRAGSWKIDTLDEAIVQLNRIIAAADEASGCPFKAISYHGNIEKDLEETLRWEMIVDV